MSIDSPFPSTDPHEREDPLLGRGPDAERLRIVLNDFAGHPFEVDLARALARHGHDVTFTYCASNATPHGAVTGSVDLTVDAVDLGRPFEKYRPLRRARDELAYGWRSLLGARRRRVRVVLAANVPVLSLLLLTVWCRASGRRLVLWLQDFQAALAGLGEHGGRTAPAAVLGWIERRVLRGAHHVVVISDDFESAARAAGVPAERIAVIENWAPIDELPERRRDNPWRARQGLGDRFTFLYSGTLATKHQPRLLLDLARDMGPEAEVVVVSEGVGADWLAREAKDRGVGNLRVLPLQPWEEMPDVLGSADVLVALLADEAGTASVPSKVLTYLCAGRPILAAVPRSNLAARVVADRALAGLVVAPEPAAFVEAARRLFADGGLRERLGASGRAYAEATFRIGPILQRFEEVLTGRPADR